MLVLNGNGIWRRGLGRRRPASAASNYMIAGTGNASRTDYPRSIVMFRPGYEREAQPPGRGPRHPAGRAARRPARLRELQGAHVALVIGG